MLINQTDVSTVRKTFEIEVPADAITREVQQVTSEFARQAKLPGFRPGKTPIHLVRSRFQKDIEEEVVKRLLPKFFHEAAAEKGFVPVSDPWLKKVGDLIDGQPLRFETEFEIRPTFEVPNYRGLTLHPPKSGVEDGELEATLDRIREQSATYRLVDDRASSDGDFVIFDVTASGEGVETRTNEGSHVRLGEESPMPELHEALFNRKPGDEVSVEKQWGEDAQDEAIRGKNVRYDMKVREIRVKELPELSDEFAKGVGFESLDELKARVRADLEHRREHEIMRAKREQAAEQLTAGANFELPETLVEEELGSSLRNYARYLASQGVDLENANMDWEKLRDDFRPEAEKRVRRHLILEEIALKERVIVSDGEVDAEIRKGAAELKQEFAEVKHRMRHDGAYEGLRMSLMRDKALDFVVSQGTIES